MLLRLRDISQNNLIRKAKVYLAGRQPPAGVKIHTGPKGKPYYMSEDLKALKESKKKEAPKKEEAGEKKKRLPAFRKQEDGSVMHRTKAGEHGPGAYRIESKEGRHYLTFEDKNGEVMNLRSHTDIKELKRMVGWFKDAKVREEESKNKSGKQESEEDIINSWKRTIDKFDPGEITKEPSTNTGSETGKGDSPISKHIQEQYLKDAGRLDKTLRGGEKKEAPIEPKQKDAALESEPVEPRSGKPISKISVTEELIDIANGDPNTPFVEAARERLGKKGIDWEAEGEKRKTKPRVNVPEKKSTMQAWKEVTHPEKYPEHQPERKTKPRVKVPDEKPVSQVKDQKATVRRRKEAETQQPEPPKRELQYDPSKLVNQHIAMTTGSAMNKYIRDAAGVDIRDDKELDRIQVAWANHSESKDHKYDNAFASWHDFVNRGGLYNTLSDSDKKTMSSYVMNQSNEDRGIVPKVPVQAIPMGERKTKPSTPLVQQAIDKHIASNKEKNIDRLVFARSGDSYLTSTGETIPANKLEQNVNRLSIEHGKYVDVLEQVNKQGDLGHTRTISTPGTEDKPFSSGDKRHDPDQKKIATGLGTTEKKKAKESVAEFGVDTRQKNKEIAEKKTRQDRLSQNRLDTKN